MTSLAPAAFLPSRASLSRNSGVLIAVGVFTAIVIILDLITPGRSATSSSATSPPAARRWRCWPWARRW